MKPRPPSTQSPETAKCDPPSAYELYEQRGFLGGNNLDDWLRAEEEIRELNGKSRTR